MMRDIHATDREIALLAAADRRDVRVRDFETSQIDTAVAAGWLTPGCWTAELPDWALDILSAPPSDRALLAMEQALASHLDES